MYSVLHLGLSYACNMKCSHCYVSRSKDRLSLEIIKQIIDELYDHGLLMVYYTYGEPLLSEMLYDVASYVASKGLIQILMTNGSLITNEEAERLKQSGISNVYVSIDSINEDKHDLNRGCKGAYKDAINGINILKKNGVRVGISTAVTNKNVNELYSIYDMALKMNINIISFLRARYNQTVVPFNKLEKEAYIRFFKFGVKQKEIALKFHDPELIPSLIKWNDEKEITSDEFEKYYNMNICHNATTVSVAPDGRVSRCNLMNHNIGNVTENSINTILKGNYKYEDIVCESPFSK